MAAVRPSSPPPPSQPPLWRASLAAALRRIARAVAPPAAQRTAVSPAAHAVERTPPHLPPGVHAAGNGASQATQGALVDPLERARAALRDARQHMTALIESDVSVTAPAPPPPPAAAEGEALGALLVELREERRALLAEIAGMRTLLQETRAEVAALRQALRERLAEVQALQQLPAAAEAPPLAPSAPSPGELIADAGAAPAAGSGDAGVESPPAHEGGSADARTPGEPPVERLPEPQPDWAPFRDFGWRLRPEAYLIDAAQATAEAGSSSEPPEAEAATPAAPPATADAPAEPPAVAEAVAANEASTAEPSDAAVAPAEAVAAEPVPAAPHISDFAPYKAPPLADAAGQSHAPETRPPAQPEASGSAAEPEPDAATAQAHGNEANGGATREEGSLQSGVHAGDRESERPLAAPQQGTVPGGHDAGLGDQAGPEADAIRLPAGSTRLVIGPVRSIGRLTALERRLVREPALAQVMLADFRRQLATIVVSARAPIDFAALAPALADEERHPVAAAWQADGALRVTLGKRAEGGA